MTPTLLRRALALAVALALLASACSDGDDGPAFVDSASSDERTTTAPTHDEQDTTEPPTETSDDREDDDGRSDGGGSLGSSTGQHPAAVGDDTLVPLRIEVTGLERHGDLVELAMTLTNEHEDVTFSLNQRFKDPELPAELLGDNRYDLSGVRLIDQGERKAYLPAVDSENVCLCTNGLGSIHLAAGESLQLHASFGGIPDAAATLDLEVPGFSPIAGLEVQG